MNSFQFAVHLFQADEIYIRCVFVESGTRYADGFLEETEFFQNENDQEIKIESYRETLVATLPDGSIQRHDVN